MCTFTIRLTDAQKASLKKQAKSNNESLNDFILNAALNRLEYQEKFDKQWEEKFGPTDCAKIMTPEETLNELEAMIKFEVQ